MSQEELTDRRTAAAVGVDSQTLKRGRMGDDKWAALGEYYDKAKQERLFIDDGVDCRISSLRARALRFKMQEGIDLLVIDYLQLIGPDSDRGENMNARVTEISRKIKMLARELECPILLLSQLNRNVETRNPPIPILADLRDSGSIEQDADKVVMLFREGEYNDEAEDPEKTDILIRKNRAGSVGSASLRFNKPRLSFEERTQY
jgi:replicative DNA helicase